MERLLFAKIPVWLAAIVLVVGLTLVGVWGYAVAKSHVFPYATLIAVKNFVVGEPEDERSLLLRTMELFTFNPAAFPARREMELLPADQLQPVRAAADAAGEMPVLDGMTFFSETEDTEYFLVMGSFDFPDIDAHWGAIAIDSDGVVHRGWSILPEQSEFLGAHIGLALTDDGVIATNVQGVLTAYEWCGGKRWEAPWDPHSDGMRRKHDAVDGYDWHHDVIAQDGRIYTMRGPAVLEVDEADGQILSEVHVLDLLRWGWRDGLHLFEARRHHGYTHESLSRENMAEFFPGDPFHYNKVDVLSEELAPLYPDFEAGDMLISMRNINLVVVVRPSTQQIVWWRHGLFLAQHDSTFVDGHVEIFDNNSASEPPQPLLVRLDLDEHRAETIFDFSQWNMLMRHMGNFERRGTDLLTVDSDVGRVIAGQLDGTIDFVFENGFTGSDGEVINLTLRDATLVDPQTFMELQASCAG